MNLQEWLGLTPAPLKTVYVSTVHGTTIRGALLHRSREMMILRGAFLADDDQNGNQKWVPLDGDVCVPMIHVEYWQEGIDPTALARNAV